MKCRILALLIWFTGCLAAPVHALMIHDQVQATANLYQTNWGHAWSEALATPGAIPARAAQMGGGAFDFSPYQFVDIFASGFVVDACDWQNEDQIFCRTSASGDPMLDFVRDWDIYTEAWLDGFWRSLPIYTLIGVWSRAPDQIDPIGGAFAIGTTSRLIIPVNEHAAYLFLGNNDGLFDDNQDAYAVSFTVFVPNPGSFVLFGLGLFILLRVRRRQSLVKWGANSAP